MAKDMSEEDWAQARRRLHEEMEARAENSARHLAHVREYLAQRTARRNGTPEPLPKGPEHHPLVPVRQEPEMQWPTGIILGCSLSFAVAALLPIPFVLWTAAGLFLAAGIMGFFATRED